MGDDLSHLDTSLGVEDDEQQDREFGSGPATTTAAYSSAAVSSSSITPSGLELTASSSAAAGLKGKRQGATAAGGSDRSQGDSWDKGGSRDQSSSGLPVSNSARDLHPETPAAVAPTSTRGAGGVNNTGAAFAELPVSLPAIRTSVPGQSVGNGVPQQQPAVATFSLGDEDDLQDIKLSSPPVKAPSKGD